MNLYEKIISISNASYQLLSNKETSRKTNNQSCDIGTEGTILRQEETEPIDFVYVEHVLTEMQNTLYPRYMISLEDDNPFGGFDDAGGNDDPFGGGGDDSNPFADAGDDPFGGGDDLFGDGSDDGDGTKKTGLIELDRKEALAEQFNIDKQIRAHFPQKFLEIKAIIDNNIELVERSTIEDVNYLDILDGIVEEYRRIKSQLEYYIGEMPEKTYDDIFGTYVAIHANLTRLKNLYVSLFEKFAK